MKSDVSTDQKEVCKDADTTVFWFSSVPSRHQKEFSECTDRIVFWTNEEVIRDVPVKKSMTIYLGADMDDPGCHYHTELPVVVTEPRSVHSRHGLTYACVCVCMNAILDKEYVQVFCDTKRKSVSFLNKVKKMLCDETSFDPDKIMQLSDETLQLANGGIADCFPLIAKCMRGTGRHGWSDEHKLPTLIIMDTGKTDILMPESPMHWIGSNMFAKTRFRIVGINLPTHIGTVGTVFHTSVCKSSMWG